LDKLIPNRLREARAARGLTQAQLARALDTHEKQICRWELGETQPRPRTVVAIADCLGVPVAHLTGGASSD